MPVIIALPISMNLIHAIIEHYITWMNSLNLDFISLEVDQAI